MKLCNFLKSKNIRERKINKSFNYYGVKLIAIEGLNCDGCIFYEKDNCISDRIIVGQCCGRLRKDNKDVIFTNKLKE